MHVMARPTDAWYDEARNYLEVEPMARPKRPDETVRVTQRLRRDLMDYVDEVRWTTRLESRTAAMERIIEEHRNRCTTDKPKP